MWGKKVKLYPNVETSSVVMSPQTKKRESHQEVSKGTESQEGGQLDGNRQNP